LNKKLLAVAFALLVAVICSGAVAAADDNSSDTAVTIQDDNGEQDDSSEEQTTTSNAVLPDPVNTRTGIGYTTIQAAIDSIFTEDGDTILCEAGTYNEDVLVSKSLTIIGADTSTTFVKSFNITSTGSGSDISGFTVTGGTGEAITLTDADHCFIHDMVISGGYSAGIALVDSEKNKIYSNTIDDSVSANYYGIYLDNSDNNWIYYNNINNSINDGIWLYQSNFNDILTN